MENQKPKILYLDDEVINLNVFKASFRTNYNVFTTSDVNEAFKILEDNHISVLITDQRMPEMNGDEFLAKSRTISEDSVKFLLTGFSDFDAVVNAVNKGNISKFITKPWNNENLKNDIDIAVELYNSRRENSRLITELEEYNRSLELKVKERTNELVRANKTKDKFLSIIGHDLRGPIGTYVSLTEFVESNVDSFDNIQLKEIIGSMKTSSNHIYSLLNNLVDWSKTQRDIIKPEIETLKLSEVLEEVFKTSKSMAEVKKIRLNFSNDIEYIKSDKNLLLTIIRNLVHNSIKFAPNAGLVNIHTSADSEFIHINVEDNGDGMSEQQLAKLNDNNTFDSKNITTTNGLGLHLCREFLEQLGGSMKFEINEMNGTTVNVKLPA